MALINKNLKRASQKTIKFYGSFDESEIAAVQDQDIQGVNFIKEETVTKVQFEAFKEEIRNETQATIQSAVTSVRADIVGDVKGMFASLEKRLNADKEERQTAANQSQSQQARDSRFNMRYEYGRDDHQGGYRQDNQYNRRDGRFQPDRRGGNPIAQRRAGGNREYPLGSGTRNCHICDAPGHPLMRCPHFHDPSYAAKKEEAFKRVRRGVSHIEQDCESNEADDLREAIDPMNQHDDQYILHVAHEQLEELEMEMVMIGDNQLNSEQTESQCVAQTELTPVERALAEPRTGGVLTSRESTVTTTDTVTATVTGTPVHCVGAVSACHHEVQGEVQQASASASQQELGLEKVLCSTNEPNGDAPHAAGQATAADSNEKVEQIEKASDESTSKHLMQKPGFSTDEGPAGAAAGHTDSEVTACSADEVPTAAAAAERTDSEVTGCSADERPTAAAAEHTDSRVTGCSADEVPTAAAAAAEYTDGEVTGCSANEEPTAALNPISTASSR